MTNRQTLDDLLARITTDLIDARIEAASRAVRAERERADRHRAEAVAYREILDDVRESLELLVPVPSQVPVAHSACHPEPESIPVAELAEVLGCDADAASVRMRLEDMTSEEDEPKPDAEGWYTMGFHWPACLAIDSVDVDTCDKYGKVHQIRNHRAHGIVWRDVTRWRYADGRDSAKADT